jgi:hypothetical protein
MGGGKIISQTVSQQALIIDRLTVQQLKLRGRGWRGRRCDPCLEQLLVQVGRQKALPHSQQHREALEC